MGCRIFVTRKARIANLNKKPGIKYIFDFLSMLSDDILRVTYSEGGFYQWQFLPLPKKTLKKKF